ncbi:hypothetical protein [Paenarthrobacter sp. YIM B13468]|uniref:hypothetical protein n=1 Tax=Paenarthrobacter sp. YIM B13468 TaxID=3366295 RepID=UPI003670DB23
MPYRIELVDGKAVLPPGGSSWKFARWHDAADRIEDYTKRAVGRELLEQERVHVELALVHRPDNDYNPNAISVAAPDEFGGDLDQRFFGYLYERDLSRIGKTLLADLAIELGGGEMRCTGIVSEGGLELDLPQPVELIMAVDRFRAFHMKAK